MAVEVTARDTETGESSTISIDDDYVLITAGSCYRHHVNAYANSTHVIIVKGRKNHGQRTEVPG